MDTKPGNNFLQTVIADDLAAGRVQTVVTRFPPEPNGYLHVGHAKSICLNFGLAERFGGHCHLRFDDTNPEKESQEFIDAIQEDVRWLGYQWAGDVRFASTYFQQFYDWAVHLVSNGDAYVCDLNAEQAREYRGTLTEPGRNSPGRSRSVEENLDLLQRMRDGEFEEGSRVLRARIDMASPNMNLRDPILYRIRKVPHHQTGDNWVIYPTYDFAHGQEDAIEGVTHSICTLEFEDHRPLYEWLLEHLPVPSRPRQYEFGRLNLNYTVTSKRKLKALVDEGIVSGWDDPRMPTIAGMRRRGFTPASIRTFCDMIGVTRSDGVVDVAMLEHAIRDDLNTNSPRAMCVLNPLKVILTDLPETHREMITAPCHPSREELGSRTLPFTREVYIDVDDFREEANKKYKRLVLGKRVRLRNAYVIEATDVVKDDSGAIVAVHAHTVPDTLGNDPADGIKPKGVIQWVSASEGRRATVRLYDRLFTHEAPDRGDNAYLELLNPDSLRTVEGAWIEPSLAEASPEQGFQFEREGYFVADRHDHTTANPVFNRTIGLRDTWATAGGDA
ncbi:MAG TPA: glutamine--tRNA ligase [Halieaceae bacterium]|jgi:glutaminyl-tRNA synthetase|uniref:glutamine--tRNA ligase/YqeY domain fusion protein n=1 Tax=Haliea TaxID=475794 RepID=UPI000C6561D5|nr:glutamine--tRNA ligase/YqeY domain fusion protein [Haliea sp.]MAD64452.1 glutamine--tRNA ligase [Haliea sp.]MAY91730.1 glutamine--tRNA ligase [Haliea sp.]MBP70456.1 glutamine--tRNA ligase [Haliea sp.]HBQ40791.1 glutamine--tRNA ligase [Halieaceae bacterium]|tara:strand:- start:2423 stop:4096 length:1674 start_codon:yes stop_codon:yes gene_type:complete